MERWSPPNKQEPVVFLARLDIGRLFSFANKEAQVGLVPLPK